MPNIGQFGPQALLNGDYLSRLVVSDQTVPALLVVLPFTIVDAATGNIDVTMTEKFEVIDAWCTKRNGAGAANTMQVLNGATAISNAMACAVDNTVTHATTIDDAAAINVIAAGGTLRITATRAAGTRDAQVFVAGFIRP